MILLGLMTVFFALIVCGVFGVGLIVTIGACCFRNWRFAKGSIVATLAAGSVTAAASCAIIGFVWRPYDPVSPTELGEAYRADFGVLPPPGISVIKARQVVLGDAGRQWLLLKASPEEINRHIAMGFTAPTRVPDDFDGKAGANAPGWWTPPTSRLQLYENQNWSKAGGWTESRAALGVDRGAGLIWFAADKMN